MTAMSSVVSVGLYVHVQICSSWTFLFFGGGRGHHSDFIDLFCCSMVTEYCIC